MPPRILSIPLRAPSQNYVFGRPYPFMHNTDVQSSSLSSCCGLIGLIVVVEKRQSHSTAIRRFITRSNIIHS